MRRGLFLLLALAPAGCVSMGKFKDQEARTSEQKRRADTLDSQVAAVTKDLEAAKKDEDDLTAKLKATADQLASAQVSNKDLEQSLKATQGELASKVADLVKKNDKLTQSLTEKQAQVEVLTKQLASAEEDKNALEKAKADELAKVKDSYEKLASGLKSEIAAGEIQITTLKGKLTVNMVDRILFDSGRADVKGDGRKVLDKLAAVLNGVQDKDIRIEGHTDNVPIGSELKGRYPSNWELSTARATAVARYLQDNARVDPARLVAAGYGEYHPVAANDTPEHKALNRRIEISLVPHD